MDSSSPNPNAAWDLTLLEKQPRMTMAISLALAHLPTLFNAVFVLLADLELMLLGIAQTTTLCYTYHKLLSFRHKYKY
jgi:hypothetical protein